MFLDGAGASENIGLIPYYDFRLSGRNIIITLVNQIAMCEVVRTDERL